MVQEMKPHYDDFREIIKDICDWKLQGGDNFLLALLKLGLDDLGCQYMGSYGSNLNEQLLLFCIDSQNRGFLL